MLTVGTLRLNSQSLDSDWNGPNILPGRQAVWIRIRPLFIHKDLLCVYHTAWECEKNKICRGKHLCPKKCLQCCEVDKMPMFQRENRRRNIWKKESVNSQSCSTLCNLMDCNPWSSSIHGILQARILQWGPILFSRGSSQLRDQTRVSRITGKFFTIWATREAPWNTWAHAKYWSEF